ncbi:pentatricopeptide repeat-containing protein At5g66520-like [Macadamia integrifolia]|uniref:pentatricopeptide repeat-containing protein At5g66520-like n=1 Tax=Macadamia integrifolia TaxID=60698 RepID=UPI001C52D307|nr:pentatricopeptide repeat-containing protein At5g66520-like [Macadamia integrifolia]
MASIASSLLSLNRKARALLVIYSRISEQNNGYHHLCWFSKPFSSWALAIKRASSPYNALRIYTQMQRQSIPFDSHSILFTLKSCTHLLNLPLIRHLHSHLLKIGFNSHVYVATSLLYAYVVVSFDDARLLFDEIPEKNTVTWNTMITGYFKLGNVEKARLVFESMPDRDLASWSAMISGYMGLDDWERGMALFRELMVNELSKPDQVTLGSILSGCAHMGSLGLLVGKSIHGFTVKNEWELNVALGTVLLDMYAKCGFLKSSYLIFERMQERNVLSWSAMICGLAHNGCAEEALSMFEKMKEAGIRPNEITFIGILSACTHAGLVDEGQQHFCSMVQEYGLEPRIQNYGCMVDLLGKAGLLEEAYEVIKTMKLEPNAIVWSSFLAACKLHKQFEMAERMIEQVLQVVKPENDGGVYSLICDIYVLNEKWEDAERVRNLMANQNVKKVRGSSFIRSGATWI